MTFVLCWQSWLCMLPCTCLLFSSCSSANMKRWKVISALVHMQVLSPVTSYIWLSKMDSLSTKCTFASLCEFESKKPWIFFLSFSVASARKTFHGHRGDIMLFRCCFLSLIRYRFICAWQHALRLPPRFKKNRQTSRPVFIEAYSNCPPVYSHTPTGNRNWKKKMKPQQCCVFIMKSSLNSLVVFCKTDVT